MPTSWLISVVTLSIIACNGCSSSSVNSTDSSRPTTTDATGAAESDSSAPALRRRPPFALSDRTAWRAALSWSASCEEAFESSRAGEDGGLAVHELAPRVAIVEVLCAGGAYQPSHVYYRYDEQTDSPAATLLEFRVPMSEDGSSIETVVETEVWGESWFAPDAYEMALLTLSRQIGDCGIWTRYSLSGPQPVLTSAAARLPCPASPGPPAQFTNGMAPAGWRAVSVPK